MLSTRHVTRLAWSACALLIPVIFLVTTQYSIAHANVMMNIAAAQSRAAAVNRAREAIAVTAIQRIVVERQRPIEDGELRDENHKKCPPCPPKKHHRHHRHPYGAAGEDA